MTDQEKPGFYAVIPADVRYCTTIPDGAKLLYGEITALCNDRGFCWATNAYFSNLYNCSADTISRWVKFLFDAGFLEVEIDKSKGNQRRIYLAGAIRKNADTLPAKMPIPIRKNAEQNTIYNNTVNSVIDTPAENSFSRWIASLDTPAIRETFTRARRVPATRFDQYLELFKLEASVKTETYHKQADVTNHFLNYSACKYERECREKNKTGGPARPADQPVRYSLPPSPNPAELVEPKYRKL